MLNIVLVEPEIPPNTGNVARLCGALGAKLHLVQPLGFQLDDKQMKRAGLDYWHLLDVQVYDSFAAFQRESLPGPKYLATTKGGLHYTAISYEENAYLLFGSETRGLAPAILAQYPDRLIRLPMRPDCRSLNLSNAVAVMAYEVMRQWRYPDLV